jgi:hypothetical protein
MLNFAAQLILTFVTLAVAVPEPFVTVQICVGFVGCVCTVTLYAPVTAVLNVNGTVPVPLIDRVSFELSAMTNPDPVSPVTVPLIV